MTETPRFSRVFHQMSKLQRKEYERMLRVCRNARRHEESFSSKEARESIIVMAVAVASVEGS